MEKFIVNKEDAKKYIADMYYVGDGSIEVCFADGRVFRGISACEDNICKLCDMQEAQAKVGLESKNIFRNRALGSAGLTFISGVGTMAASYFATTGIPALHAYASANPTAVAAGVGVITVLSLIPGFAKLCKNKRLVDNLDLIQYRDENRDILDSYKSHPNSLCGLDDDLARWLACPSSDDGDSFSDDPFSIVNLYRFTKADLETIVNNIQTEQDLGFAYVRRRRSSK